jgi:hypothetical protein
VRSWVTDEYAVGRCEYGSSAQGARDLSAYLGTYAISPTPWGVSALTSSQERNRKRRGKMQTIRAVLTRLFGRLSIVLLSSALVLTQTSAGTAKTETEQPAKEHDAQHDWDWEIGTWKLHVRRLLHPLTGSTTWVEYNGSDVVRKIWDGRANIGEFEADGPQGHLEILTLRLYNPDTRQWSINVANSAGGTLSPPAVGNFDNGHGEFFDQETYKGKIILLRFRVSMLSPTSCRLDQAFSTDGGKSWEVNLIDDETLVK